MAKYLVIVESPAKVRTISKFLGANYTVMASNGHVRDMPKSQLGFDAANDYEPKYITIRGKGDILAKLRKAAQKADRVYLATDPDREGEAISWHLAQVLRLPERQIYRITFNEITKTAVKESIKNARVLDMDKVDAQQARRLLDRMVGYRISPLLWAKVKRGLSAGRVQSVAVRIICDREAEINAFLPVEYWNLAVILDVEGEKSPLHAKYYGTPAGRVEISSREQLDGILADLDGVGYAVSEVKKGERVKKSPLPFITSTLQQEAGNTLGYSAAKTMKLAQQLYEGVDVKGKGTIGLITYLRTDSTRISAEAKSEAAAYIENEYGREYLAPSTETKAAASKGQDAHEAIRPSVVSLSPTMLKESLTRDQLRLYQLIWRRFVASQMAAARYETTSVRIDSVGQSPDKKKTPTHRFTVSASKVIFPGFTTIYTEADDKDKNEAKTVLARSIDLNTRLTWQNFDFEQHFTQPPPHYTEASLVKILEELGIGRPSTYAPTISTIIARRYVIKENKSLYVTELGEVVNKIMVDAFPTIVDVHFTANLETLFDGIEHGDVKWKTVIRNFYPDLDEAVQAAEKELGKVKVADEVSDQICEKCGKNMVVKYGPHGKFLACPGFPDCRFTGQYLEKIGIECPRCNKDIVVRKSKKGRRYYGCSDSPACDFMVWQKPSGKKCPICGDVLLAKGKKLACANGECRFVQ
ncbi:MAG: type I DNA topoisomerase [Lachnospiraceae bacterium]|jgi:DNA topoisomerase-1|nr:type I DNA topoisomerase [Lachnospiraceae bacterium]